MTIKDAQLEFAKKLHCRVEANGYELMTLWNTFHKERGLSWEEFQWVHY